MTLKTEKTRKREEAETRQAKYDSIPLRERIEMAHNRRGDSRKEITRLMHRLHAEETYNA